MGVLPICEKANGSFVKRGFWGFLANDEKTINRGKNEIEK